jgi:D-alanyl-D-alanine carboxypeptidase
MKNFILITIFCSFSLYTKLSVADNFEGLKIPLSKLANEYIENNTFVGIQVAVRYENKEIFNNGYGFANIKEKIPFTNNTIVALGSNTKTFTSTAIQLLANQELINLNDQVEKYFPINTFKNSNITIRNLLCHTSGIADIYEKENYGNINHSSLQKFSNLVDNFPKSSNPNEKYEYNNTGYLFLGRIIEQVSQQSLGDFYRESIIAPLGLSNTLYLGDTFSPLNMAQSYDEDFSLFNSEHEDYTEYRIAHSAGALGGTIHDYLLWHQSILQGKLLLKENIHEMKKPCMLNDGNKTKYGLGLEIKRVEGYNAFSHGGAINGFTSDAYYFPERNLTIVFVSNTWTNPTEFRDKLLELVLNFDLDDE